MLSAALASRNLYSHIEAVAGSAYRDFSRKHGTVPQLPFCSGLGDGPSWLASRLRCTLCCRPFALLLSTSWLL